MAKNAVLFGVIVLAVIAAVLGYKIYQQQKGLKNQPASTTQQSVIKTNPSTQQSGSTPSSSAKPAHVLTAEEKTVLNFPGPNATVDEIKAHSDLVNKLGNQSGVPYLDISGCSPNPVVYRVKQGSSFTVKNTDQTDHTIYTAIRTTIKANSSQTLTSKSIGDNLGDYGYNCDGSTSVIGILQIVP